MSQLHKNLLSLIYLSFKYRKSEKKIQTDREKKNIKIHTENRKGVEKVTDINGQIGVWLFNCPAFVIFLSKYV